MLMRWTRQYRGTSMRYSESWNNRSINNTCTYSLMQRNVSTTLPWLAWTYWADKKQMQNSWNIKLHLTYCELKFIHLTLRFILSEEEYFLIPFSKLNLLRIPKLSLKTAQLQINKSNTSNTEAPFLDLHLSISNGFVSSKIYDKRDDFDFDIVNFPFLDGDVLRSTSYGVYISQRCGWFQCP